jgi:hypothetical protein
MKEQHKFIGIQCLLAAIGGAMSAAIWEMTGERRFIVMVLEAASFMFVLSLLHGIFRKVILRKDFLPKSEAKA